MEQQQIMGPKEDINYLLSSWSCQLPRKIWAKSMSLILNGLRLVNSCRLPYKAWISSNQIVEHLLRVKWNRHWKEQCTRTIGKLLSLLTSFCYKCLTVVNFFVLNKKKKSTWIMIGYPVKIARYDGIGCSVEGHFSQCVGISKLNKVEFFI